MRRVEVHASRNYDVLIGRGLLAEVGPRVAAVIPPCAAALIADDTVDALYGDRAAASLAAAGFDVRRFSFPHGEKHKNLHTLSDILEFMASQPLTRSDIVVALGGGVTGDMAGFAAAVYARGIRFVQIPTTLLAAVDSSVGGKTAVDLAAAKNMAGAFCQPSLVLIDTDILEALPPDLLSDGAAEVVKYGILADPALFERMRRGELTAGLEEIVRRCVAIKRDVVEQDEFDTGRRRLLNLGHTLGHALEELSGYALSHGRCVAIGTCMISRAAWKNGISETDLFPAVAQAFAACGLPTEAEFPPEEIARAALADKKRRGGTITLAVPRRIGECVLLDVPVEELIDWCR